MKALSKDRLKQIAIFITVGVGTALLELVVFSILYRLVGIGTAPANVIAIIVSTATNFFLNGTVTFKGSSNMIRSAVLYLALFLFNTFFSTTVISLGADIGLPAEAVKLATMACIAIWDFVLYRKVVFI